MILGTEEDRLLVISDLHLGNPASNAEADLPDLFDEVARTGTALCINGDGFELLSASAARLATTGFPIIRQLHDLAARVPIYYVVGNHDLALEHLLLDMPFTVSPFLNVRSGGQLIRVEHGHVYEPIWAGHQALYEAVGRAGRFLRRGSRTDTYEVFTKVHERVDDFRRRRGEHRPYYHHDAADALFQRGFDAVVFGHTHRPEVTARPGGTFVNGGDWIRKRTFVLIDRGRLHLGEWAPGARLDELLVG
jgi:UDP-2,3-diacylglucosamine pyrophosphatase LpxH